MLSQAFHHTNLQLSSVEVFRTTHPFGQQVAISVEKIVLGIGIIFAETTEPIGCSTCQWENALVMLAMNLEVLEHWYVISEQLFVDMSLYNIWYLVSNNINITNIIIWFT